jgi:hypothetical protein
MARLRQRPGTAAGLVNVAEPLLAHRVSAALTAGTAMLVLALVLVLALIVRPAKPRKPLRQVISSRS